MVYIQKEIFTNWGDGPFIRRWLGMYATLWTNDAGSGPDLQTLGKGLELGETKRTTQRIPTDPPVLLR